MSDLTPITRQEPGVVLLENYDEVKAFLTEQLEHYRHIVYTENSLKDAKLLMAFAILLEKCWSLLMILEQINIREAILLTL